MTSLFDSTAFNDSLFFPMAVATPPPPWATDRYVEVPGATLHLRWHRSLQSAPTVLLFHGNGETVGDYDTTARTYARVGANLAVVDYRGYGQSTGQPTLRLLLGDAVAVYEAMVEATSALGVPLFVMGRSLGSACAAELYGRRPEHLRGLIWESGASDLLELVRRRGVATPQQLSDEDRATFDPLPKLGRGDRPFLALHGSEDDLIRPHEAEQALLAAGTEHKRLVYIPGRGHNDLSGAPLYWEALGSFLTGT